MMAVAGDGTRLDAREPRYGRIMRSRRHVGVAVALVGLGGMVVATFMPWLHSGDAERSSFEALSSAHRLGIAEAGWQRVLVDLWYFVPFLGAVALIALLLGRRAVFGGLVIALAVVAIAVALYVIVAADAGMGPIVTCGWGAVAFVGGLSTLVPERRTP